MLAVQHAPAAMMGLDQRSVASSVLQFSLEVDEDARPENTRAAAAALEGLCSRLAWLASPMNPFAERLQRDVRRLVRLMSREGGVDVVVLASRLCLQGYNVIVRTALGGGPACFKNLRHEFLSVQGEGEWAECSLIVDPSFREQFEIPQPTRGYSAALALLAPEFVGSASRLIPLVQCLCAEMAASFEAEGLTLPPWRRAQAMLSKWLPQRSRDVCFNSSSGDGGGGSSVRRTSSGGNAGGGCCSSDGEGSSPTSEAAGGSPFSRISVGQLCGRTASGRSLLSGKFGSPAAAAAAALCGGGRTSSRAPGHLASGGARASGGGLAAAGAAAASGGGLQRGSVCKQPPMYHGQPATYTVKMAAACVAPR